MTLYYNLPNTLLNRLQHIQNSLPRAVVTAPESSHINRFPQPVSPAQPPWGSVVSSPSGVRGGAPAAIEFYTVWMPKKPSGDTY